MRSRLTALAVLLVLVAVALVGAFLVPHDPHRLTEAVAAAGPWAPLGLLGAWVLGTCTLFPQNVLCALAGALLGPVGVLVSLVGSPLGALAAFGLARLLAGRADHTHRVPARLQGPLRKLEGAGAGGVAVVRLAPALPAPAFSYACGLTQLRARHFALGSALGAAPRVLIYGALGGAAAAAGPLVLLVGVAFGALGLAAMLLVRRRTALLAV